MQTKIVAMKDDEIFVHGRKLVDFIGKHSFGEVAYFIIRGLLPSPKEAELFEALLSAASIHRLETPSNLASRQAARGGAEINAALAAGILAFGKKHGAAIQGAAEVFRQARQDNQSAEQVVQKFSQRGERLPGFGHRYYKNTDPRVDKLYELAKKLGFAGFYVELSLEIARQLEEQKGRPLPLNIDGGMGALLLELGFEPRALTGIFVLARLPGLLANILEEMS